MTMRRLRLQSLLLAACSGAAMSEDVTVTATRLPKALDEIPAAVSVVSRDEVQLARQQIALDESLARVPGVFMLDRYNFAQDLRVSIRGFGARANFGIRGVRIFVDGIPETLPDGQGQLDSVDLGSVERITVLRGASSALYGNASGGVILVDSEPPPENTTLDARLSIGELGFDKHQLKAGGTAGRLGYLVNFANLEMAGFREQSRVESRSVNGAMRYTLGTDSWLRMSFNHTDQPVSQDAGALTLEQLRANPRQASAASAAFDAGESLEQTRFGFVYEKSFGAHHELAARNYYVWRDFENALAFQAGGTVAIDRFFAGGGLAYTNRSTLAGRDNRLIVGVDVDNQNDERKRFDNDFGSRGALAFSQTEKVTGTGVFLQDELTVSDRMTWTLGLRHDRVRFEVDDRFTTDGDDSGRRTLSETSPMVGLLYRASSAVNVYANAATSFETPTTTELADPAGGGFNAALEPQLATNVEIGVKGELATRHHYSLALFRIDVEDELIPFELPESPGRSFFRNAGRSVREGVELSVASEPLEGLKLSLAYTYSDFTFDRFTDDAGNDFSGRHIPGLPHNTVHGDIAWRHSTGIFAALEALYVDRFFADNANTVRDGGYTLGSLRLGYVMDHGPWRWSVFGGANNLFDETYNANVRINAAAGRYFEPGPPRNVYVGVQLKWAY
jgi:iron complex outermembrane recepter protein